MGTYAVQLGNHFGASVTGVCGSRNVDLVKSLGANNVVDYTSQDFPRQLEKYDAILIAVDKWPFASSHPFLKPGGVYMNVTNPIKSFAMMTASRKYKQRFVMGGNPPDSGADLSYLSDLAEKGILQPVIDKMYTIEEIVEAHRYVEAGHKKGNVVITVAGPGV